MDSRREMRQRLVHLVPPYSTNVTIDYGPDCIISAQRCQFGSAGEVVRDAARMPRAVAWCAIRRRDYTATARGARPRGA